jgi:hypothetical protein
MFFDRQVAYVVQFQNSSVGRHKHNASGLLHSFKVLVRLRLQTLPALPLLAGLSEATYKGRPAD